MLRRQLEMKMSREGRRPWGNVQEEEVYWMQEKESVEGEGLEGDGVDPAGLGAGVDYRAASCRGNGQSGFGVSGGRSGVGIDRCTLDVCSTTRLCIGGGSIHGVDGGSGTRSGMSGVSGRDVIRGVRRCDDGDHMVNGSGHIVGKVL
eukprot:g26415.t1